ncbi:hypothetical protein CVT26_013387 [Gymnopilus dilepis]|uniref:Zn(2)-C6 fungal-type domain-containing protein n=1 Tax=Gymnopilus dilepis TaxID=231916 RepID=A0A409WDE2_9AGAR|nr:hypothetical protein CVT26_013387 [Gymnopilus dilepis]
MAQPSRAQDTAERTPLSGVLLDSWLFEQDLRRCLKDVSTFEDRFSRVLAPDFHNVLQGLKSVQFRGEHITDVLAPLFSATNNGQVPNFESVRTAVYIWDWHHPTVQGPDLPLLSKLNNYNTGLDMPAEQGQHSSIELVRLSEYPHFRKENGSVEKQARSEKESQQATTSKDKGKRPQKKDEEKTGKMRKDVRYADEGEDDSVIGDGGTGSENVPFSRNLGRTKGRSIMTLESSPEPEHLRENDPPCHQCSYADEKCFVVRSRRSKHFKRACGRCSSKKTACSFSLHPDLQKRLKDDPNVPVAGPLTQKDILKVLDYLKNGIHDLQKGQLHIRQQIGELRHQDRLEPRDQAFFGVFKSRKPVRETVTHFSRMDASSQGHPPDSLAGAIPIDQSKGVGTGQTNKAHLTSPTNRDAGQTNQLILALEACPESDAILTTKKTSPPQGDSPFRPQAGHVLHSGAAVCESVVEEEVNTGSSPTPTPEYLPSPLTSMSSTTEALEFRFASDSAVAEVPCLPKVGAPKRKFSGDESELQAAGAEGIANLAQSKRLRRG